MISRRSEIGRNRSSPSMNESVIALRPYLGEVRRGMDRSLTIISLRFGHRFRRIPLPSGQGRDASLQSLSLGISAFSAPYIAPTHLGPLEETGVGNGPVGAGVPAAGAHMTHWIQSS